MLIKARHFQDSFRKQLLLDLQQVVAHSLLQLTCHLAMAVFRPRRCRP